MCIWVGVVAFNCINQSLWRWYKLWKGNNRGRQFCGDQINVLCSHHLHLQPWKQWLCGYSLLSADMQRYLMMLNSILTCQCVWVVYPSRIDLPAPQSSPTLSQFGHWERLSKLFFNLFQFSSERTILLFWKKWPEIKLSLVPSVCALL